MLFKRFVYEIEASNALSTVIIGLESCWWRHGDVIWYGI